MTLVVILTVRRDALQEFRTFERHAARVIETHGGRIERTVVVTPVGSPEVIKEVHIVTFPNEHAFATYRADEQLARFAHLRDQSVVHTEILAGEDGPSYAAS